ncbi:MAG: exosortase C-terminal domain/associated protein EpsI, partial [Gammaproteobacteria bacterium]
ACSGMRYLIAMATVGALFAYLNYQSYWRRTMFILASIGIAIIGNWLRAYGIVMIGHFSGMKLAVGIDHYIYGWVFFGVLIFVLMTVGMIWSEPRKARQFSTAPAVTGADRRSPLVAILCGGLLAIAWPLLASHLAEKGSDTRPELVVAPDVLGSEWTLVDREKSLWWPQTVGEPFIARSEFARGGTRLGWFVAWYGRQDQDNEAIHHQNRLVIERRGTFAMNDSRLIASGLSEFGQVRESKLKSRVGETRLVVWQWYWSGGHATAHPVVAKFYGLLAQLRGLGNAGAWVVLSTPAAADESIAAVRQRLREGANALLPQFQRAFARAIGT